MSWLALWNGLVTGCLALAAVGFVWLLVQIAMSLSAALDDEGDGAGDALEEWDDFDPGDPDEPPPTTVVPIRAFGSRRSQ